jgi:UDP-glucuronate 4-epimerase
MTQRDSCTLVTGAAGFIGSHVSQALLARGGANARVVGLDNFDSFYAEPIKRDNIAQIERGAGGRFTLVQGDLRDAGALEQLFSEHKPDTVIHLAARAGVRPSIADPALYADVNVLGTTRLLLAAENAGCKRLVLASSSSVYGGNTKLPFSETDDVNEPISPYAATKRACELLAHTHHHLYGASVACLRFFTVYGPCQRPDLAISKFMKRIAAGEPIPFFGAGDSSRDYTFIEDIVSGVLAAVDHIDTHGYRIWNLGSSSPISLTEMIDAVAAIVGCDAIIDRKPTQPGDAPHTFADVSRSHEELGYAPAMKFHDGLKQQWDWLKPSLNS